MASLCSGHGRCPRKCRRRSEPRLEIERAQRLAAVGRGSANGWNYDVGFRVAMVPEPSSMILAGFGLIGLVAWGCRRKRA